MVNNPISHRRFVDVSHLWVADIETKVRSVFVFLFFQISVQLKDVWFKVEFKLRYITLVAFTFLKLLPRQKKILGRNNLIK